MSRSAIVAHVEAAFGGIPTFNTYPNDGAGPALGVLCARDRPGAGVTSYSTIGLSDHPMIGPGGEFPTRLELAGVSENDVTIFPDLLAAAAACIRRTPGVFYPGSVMLNVAQRFISNSPLVHVYLTTPFLWKGRLRTLQCSTKMVSWLLAMPISQSEYRYRVAKGDEAFENLLQEREVDIFDLHRAPAV